MGAGGARHRIDARRDVRSNHSARHPAFMGTIDALRHKW
jgi:hypothetical protein